MPFSYRLSGKGEFTDKDGRVWSGEFLGKTAPGLRLKLSWLSRITSSMTYWPFIPSVEKVQQNYVLTPLDRHMYLWLCGLTSLYVKICTNCMRTCSCTIYENSQETDDDQRTKKNKFIVLLKPTFCTCEIVSSPSMTPASKFLLVYNSCKCRLLRSQFFF